MPEAMLFCEKCRGITVHRVRWDNTAVCMGCGDERDVDKPPVRMVEAKRMRPERRV
jgi:DNA-directed RNA polymerase subunit M/transcription elongation factor TFIIS